MTSKSRKPRKSSKSPNEIITGWFDRQDISLADEARGNWEAGQVAYLDYTETVITHCERYFADDDSGRFIVVCWDEGGNVTFGGL